MHRSLLRHRSLGLTLMLGGAALAFAPAAAQADLIAYEGYETGGNGAGFDEPRVLTQEPDTAATPSLEFGSLATTPGRGVGGQGQDTFGERALTNPVDVTDGPVWVTFLQRLGDYNNEEYSLIHLNRTLGDNSTEFQYRTGVVANSANDNPQWAYNDIPDYGGIYTNQPELPQTEKTYFQVVRINDEPGNDISLNAWLYTDPVNFPTEAPTMSDSQLQVAGDGTDTVTYTLDDGETPTLENLGFEIQNFPDDGAADPPVSPFYFDEIRAADTFADAAPVPEPTTLAMLGLGAGLIACRRRSRT